MKTPFPEFTEFSPAMVETLATFMAPRFASVLKTLSEAVICLMKFSLVLDYDVLSS